MALKMSVNRLCSIYNVLYMLYIASHVYQVNIKADPPVNCPIYSFQFNINTV